MPLVPSYLKYLAVTRNIKKHTVFYCLVKKLVTGLGVLKYYCVLINHLAVVYLIQTSGGGCFNDYKIPEFHILRIERNWDALKTESCRGFTEFGINLGFSWTPMNT